MLDPLGITGVWVKETWGRELKYAPYLYLTATIYMRLASDHFLVSPFPLDPQTEQLTY